MKKLLNSLAVVAALILSVAPTYAQTTVTTTTTTAAITGGVNAAKTVYLTSLTNVAVGSGLFIDAEAFSVATVNTSNNSVGVIRGQSGTKVAPHISGSTVYVGPTSGVTGQGPFWSSDPPIGGCVASAEQYSLRINVQNARIWQCTNSQWMNVIDAYIWVGPGQCNSSVSGNGTGTNGLTSIGTAPSIPVVNAQTSVTGTNTHYFVCSIPPPSRIGAVKSTYVVDVAFYYGVQTTGLGTQVATLASGTMNSQTVFSYIDYPTAAASETATGLAEKTRADSGTLTITPAVGSFNVATTTAGQFYSAKFIPATPIAMATDNRQLLLTVSLLNTASSATVTNSPGFLVHYRTLQAGF